MNPKPLYLLIWVYGVYFAAMPLLLKVPSAEELASIREMGSSIRWTSW